MTASQVLDWLNENEYRGYPLRETGVRTVAGYSLDNILLDAQIVYRSVALPTDIKLTNVVISGNIVTITVSSQPTFVFNKNTVTFPYYVRNSEGSLLVVGEAIKSVPAGSYTLTDSVFEDSVSFEMRGPYLGVTSIQYDTSSPLIGTHFWNEGYQFDISISGSTISLGAGSNFGTPISCESFFDTLIPDDCDEIVSSINGATPISNPDAIRFVANDNVVIFEDPPNHRLYIGLNFDKQDVCKFIISNPSPNIR